MYTRTGKMFVRLPRLLLLLSLLPWLLAAAREDGRDTEDRGSCGAESLWALARELGTPITKEVATARLGRKGETSSMLKISEVAGDIGIPLSGRRIKYDELSKQSRPAIAHMKWGHYIVVARATDEEVVMIDGYDQRITTTADTFRKQWSGTVLLPHSNDWATSSGIVLVGMGVAGLILSVLRSRFRGERGKTRSSLSAPSPSDVGLD